MLARVGPGRRRTAAGSSNTSGSRLAPPRSVMTGCPTGTRTPATSVSRCATRPVRCTGESNRSTSSTAFGQSAGSARSRSRWSGCSMSRAVPLPMRFTVVSKPAASSSIAVAVSSSWRELALRARARARASRGCCRRDGRAGARSGLPSTAATRAGPRSERRKSRSERPGVERARRLRPPGEELAAHRDRRAEHLGDDRGGQQARVLGHQVDVAAALEAGEQLVGDLLGAAAQRGHGPRGERAGDELAVAGVVGRVDGQHRGRLDRPERPAPTDGLREEQPPRHVAARTRR